MVQIPSRARTRTLSFSVGESRARPVDLLSRGEEPDAKRARQSYSPIRVPRNATPLAPKSVNLTVTAVPFPTDDDPQDDQSWGTSALPTGSSKPKPKRLVARTVSVPPIPPPEHVPECVPDTRSMPLQATRACRPSPLTPHWVPPARDDQNTLRVSKPRRGRLPPEPLARKALKAHFARTPHGAAVVKLGARRAIAQAECVAALERVRRLSAEKSPGQTMLSRAVLLPPVVMVEPREDIEERPVRSPSGPVQFPTSPGDGEWVPLSVQPPPIEVEVAECDIVEMETDEWGRL